MGYINVNAAKVAFKTGAQEFPKPLGQATGLQLQNHCDTEDVLSGSGVFLQLPFYILLGIQCGEKP